MFTCFLRSNLPFASNVWTLKLQWVEDTKKKVRGLPQLEVSNVSCEDCFVNRRASKILTRIDICSPKEPISHVGKRYFLCFINDYNLKGWVYVLFKKIRCLGVFQDLHEISGK